VVVVRDRHADRGSHHGRARIRCYGFFSACRARIALPRASSSSASASRLVYMIIV